MKKSIIVALVLIAGLSFCASAAMQLGSADRSDTKVITRESLSENATKNINVGAKTTDVTKLANVQAIFGTEEAGTVNITGINVGVDRWIEIANQGTNSANLTGWSLSNQAKIVYSLPGITLDPGFVVKVHEGLGADNQTDLYTNLSEPLINETGDLIQLLDASGAVIATYAFSASAPPSEPALEARSPEKLPLLIDGAGIGADKNPATASILLDNTSGRSPELMPVLINSSALNQSQQAR